MMPDNGVHFIPVLDPIRKNFTVKEVPADMAYSSMKNLAYSEPRLHERNQQRGVTSVWKRMYHYFNFNRPEFVQNYMNRSNVGNALHMSKSKFGSTLKSRTFEAQKNEALCKVICHNIACLIHAINEFGIEI